MTMRTRNSPIRKILMTLDAAGGVWRYAMDLASGLRPLGIETVFACFGPPPSAEQADEAEAIGRLIVHDAPLDWMVENEAALAAVQQIIADTALREKVDLVHLNLPSQAAGFEAHLPVVVVAHSCVCTWFQGVRSQPVPASWKWQLALNRQGFNRADAVLMPSRSHAALSRKVYGPIDRLHIVYNATQLQPKRRAKADYVFAAGRWWDEGKNSAILNAAAPDLDWPVLTAGATQGPNGQHVTMDKVRHRGELSHAETMTLMGDAAIVVSPSVYEPFGLAALEAARGAGALVLADIPTYRELWDGIALFADPHDPAAFTAAINRLSRDPVLRERMGREALTRSRKFTLEAQAWAVSAIYDSLQARTDTLTAAE